MKSITPSSTDQFLQLKALTPARVRLDPSNGPIPLADVLDFQLSHARARDAIYRIVDWDRLRDLLGPQESVDLHSRATDRQMYLKRPDLGRRLDSDSVARLHRSKPDLVIVIADGLSAEAVNNHAGKMTQAIVSALGHMTIGPICFVQQGRVAIGDEIAEIMGAALCLILVGERPGLSVSDSLGAYLTWNGSVGTRDDRRNCVSNIHGNGGLSYPEATGQLLHLISKARLFQATGLSLNSVMARLEGPDG